MKTENIIARLLTSSWLLVGLCIVLALFAGSADRGTVQMWSFVVINVLLAQSINLLTGITGQISLGHAGYFAIGAYVSSLSMKNLGLEFPFAVAISMAFTALIGYLISLPAGRVREFYLAMMSLAFGLIVYEIVREWQGLTGGVMGLRGVPSPQIGTLILFGWKLDDANYFRIMLVVLLVVMFMLRNFVKSHFGRAFFAVHTSELAAGTMGISQSATKRFAYAISGGIAGLAGSFYAHLVGYLTPESFGLMRSIEILVMSIVGGLGSLMGQVLGATLFTYLPQQLQAFANYQFIVYGLILMFVFTLLPKGIAGVIGVKTRYSKFDQLKTTNLQSKTLIKPLTFREPVKERTQSNALVRVSNVTMEFSGLRALSSVSLDLYPGSVTALIGPNGSGKSTLVNVISGIYKPTSGNIIFKGQEIGGWPSFKVARVGVTRTFQDPRNVASFTVRENILMGANRLYQQGAIAASLNLPKANQEELSFLQRVDVLMETCGLDQYANDEIGDLPYGIQRLAEVVRALASDPELLMLDEPAAGLSEQESKQLIKLIRMCQNHGIAVMVIDHHMDFLADVVDDVVVFEAGEEIYRGNMQGMRTNQRVIEAYLGEEEVDHA